MTEDRKATLYEVVPQGKPNKKVTAQFNPETLRITHAGQIVSPVNQSKSSGVTQQSGLTDQPGSTPHQQPGPGSTRLSVQLWFDVTGELPLEHAQVSDVRELTDLVAYFIKERKPATDDGTPQPAPMVQFCWGSLVFTGVMDSLDETLELFSTEGVPLRASVNIGISQGEVVRRPAGGAGGPSAGLNLAAGLSAGIGIGASASLGVGSQPLVQAEAGVSLQAMASATFGADADWQSIATANGIENPRMLQPGQLINMNARASASDSGSVSASAAFSLRGE